MTIAMKHLGTADVKARREAALERINGGPRGEGSGEAPAPGVGLPPGVADVAVDDGRVVGVHARGALEERQGGERGVVGRRAAEAGLVGVVLARAHTCALQDAGS